MVVRKVVKELKLPRTGTHGVRASPAGPSRACGSASAAGARRTSATPPVGRSAAWPGASQRADRPLSVRACGSRRPEPASQRTSPTRADQREVVAASKDSSPLRWGRRTAEGFHFGVIPRQSTVCISPPCRATMPVGDRRSAVARASRRSAAFRSPMGRGAGLKIGGPSHGAAQCGGGGGNRTRVRKSSATTSTCISGLWAGTRARRRLSLFRSRVASTRRIAARNLSLVLTDGSGRPPAKPA